MAVFIIKRKLEQREFAATSITDLLRGDAFQYYQPSLNVMKLIEMYFLTDSISGKNYHAHWLDMTVSSISNHNKFIYPQQFFVWIEDKNTIEKVLGKNNANILFEKFANDPNEFLSMIQYHMLNDTNSIDNSTAKYKDWFSKNPIQYSNKEYLLFYKYIALCLSGQLNPDMDDINNSSCQSKIRATKINYNTNRYSNKNLIIDIIYKCIKRILWQWDQ